MELRRPGQLDEDEQLNGDKAAERGRRHTGTSFLAVLLVLAAVFFTWLLYDLAPLFVANARWQRFQEIAKIGEPRSKVEPQLRTEFPLHSEGTYSMYSRRSYSILFILIVSNNLNQRQRAMELRVSKWAGKTADVTYDVHDKVQSVRSYF